MPSQFQKDRASAAHVKFTSTKGTTLSVLVGDNSPNLTNGVTTWDTVPRPKRTSLTRYTGRTPFSQDIPILFDGLTNDPPDDNQEGRIHKLITMASGPHLISLDGHALRTDLDWVFSGIDWDNQNVLWRRGKHDAYRVRQAATVHMLQYIKDVILRTPAQPKTQGKDPTKKVKLPKGMTLKQIAQIEFGDPDKWHRIVVDNPFLIFMLLDKPSSLIPMGTQLNIFDGAIPVFNVP